jgi:predicted PhzF superfamily epimerase YddE/YHI9
VAELHVLRVFINEDREWGNPLGVFLAGGGMPKSQRQRIAAELGFSETVFVEDRASGAIRIHSPTVELPFAGHPSVGTAWLLARQGAPPTSLRTAAGEVGVRYADDAVFVRARPEWSPPFEFVELPDPASVRALEAAPVAGNAYAWAWIDQSAGTIRARSFVPQAGIAEDEATGSAALALCARLSRPLVIHQGHGSVLQVEPAGGGLVEVGGAVAFDEVSRHPLDQRA